MIITDYPKQIKSFDMRQNDDGKTVAAMDVLVPKVGEIIGGSQREERLDLLKSKIREMGLHEEDYWWYLELRKYGSVLMQASGRVLSDLFNMPPGWTTFAMSSHFPRYPGKAEF